MYILSPKSNFLGGALVSASHLGQLCRGKLLVWQHESEFLNRNNVPYEVVRTWYGFLRNIAVNDLDRYDESTRSIWCNDTCVDEGYYPEVRSKNIELWSFLANFDNVILVNHQPINRYSGYLIDMLNYLKKHNVKKITILNYRACWNDEWNNELKVLFPEVIVTTLPYHYYYYPVQELPVRSKTELAVMIGRSNSKCKIQSQLDNILEVMPEVKQILPDNTVPNIDFIRQLSKYQYILTGYYYGGEGNPEQDVRYNHLEWSYMDAVFANCIPLTSSLFSKELERLGFNTPILDYRFRDVSNIKNKLLYSGQRYMDIVDSLKKKLIIELDNGNNCIKSIILDQSTYGY